MKYPFINSNTIHITADESGTITRPGHNDLFGLPMIYTQQGNTTRTQAPLIAAFPKSLNATKADAVRKAHPNATAVVWSGKGINAVFLL